MINLDTVGLILSIIGTLLVAFWAARDPNEWVEGENGDGKKKHALYIKHPCFLSCGIILMLIGFTFSLVDSLLK